MQVKLLRAIQEKSVRPVGTQTEVRIDVRVLCATHRDLSALVREGKFRQDLYYRLNVIELTMPSLRSRPEDIPLLTEQFCARLTESLGGKNPRLSEDALQALANYDFPGNVRELENILERALTLYEGAEISAEDLRLPAVYSEDIEDEPDYSGTESLEEHLERVERNAIRLALQQTSQNKTAAAKVLGITFRALRYKLEKLGIE
jgi:two-component system response regulator PilR (NtrC family)